ncbi:hypothetical protein V8D89_002401 [Ganoderma adspersum]
MGHLHNLFATLSVFWALLYVFRYYRRRSSKLSLLPSPTSSTKSQSPELLRTPTTRVTLSNFHLGIHSTAFNPLLHHFATRLKGTRWRNLLNLVYDAGSALGVFGMLGSVILLMWTTMQLLSSVNLNRGNMHFPSAVLSLHKREDLLDQPSSALSPNKSRDVPLQLIIPGVTTPLHHLPILLGALLATQIFHELGHALAAALDSLPLTSAGLGFTVLLPSAFVSFPAEQTESLPPRARIRIISAGAFHNLIFWLFLAATTWASVSEIVWPLLGYQDVSAYGRVVVHIDEGSPLHGYLPIGSVVYKVGDDALGGPGGATARWEALLSSKRNASIPALGWCIEEPWFAAHNASCCSAQRSEVSFQSCFVPDSDPGFERCVDPLLFLDAPDTASTRRCASSVDCGHGQLCIRPRGDQELVSFTIHVPPWLRKDKEDVERKLVWQGDSLEILDEVEVGDWLLTYGVLPMGLPVIWNTLFLYLKMLSLSLYFVNLLPLPFLDGGQLFDALYDWWTSERGDPADGETVILDQLEAAPLEAERVSQSTRSLGATRRKAWWRRAVHVSVGMLTGCYVLLSFMKIS